MAYTPPSIRINGGSPGVKASVAAAGAVTATLDSTDGVTHVQWSISTTDETTATTDYTLTPSGALGENVATTALVAGTAAILYVKVNRGVDPRTGLVNLDATTATCKFYVPTTATNLEVGCAGEDFESNATFGSTGIINSGVRATTSVAAGIQNIPFKDDVYAVTTANVALTGAPAMADTDNVTVPNGERLLVGNNQVTAANRGIYVVNTTGAWTRATDADDEASLIGATVYVANGATSKGFVYQQTVQTPITVGVTGLSWARTADRFDRADLAAATDAATAGQLFRRDGSGGGSVAYLAASSYVTIGSNVSTTGALRLGNATSIKWRNAANSADVDGVAVDNADKMLIGDATDTAGIGLYLKAANSVDLTFAGNTRIAFKDALVEFQPAATAHLKQADATAGAGASFTITAQTAFAGIGGQVRINTGRGATNADQCGTLTFDVGDDTTDSAPTTFTTRTLGDIAYLQHLGASTATWLFTPTGSGYALGLQGDNGIGANATAGSVLLMSNFNQKFAIDASGATFFGGAGYGTGTNVVSIANATADPTTNPTGGGILYASGGAGKWRGSGGTVTTFGPAEPHCPTCTRDFAVEYENECQDEHIAICWACLLDELKRVGIDIEKVAFRKKLHNDPWKKVPAQDAPNAVPQPFNASPFEKEKP